jgi:gas vesicle protein
MNKNSLSGFSIGLGVGLVVGGVLGLLFAPQKGSETRKVIKDKADLLIEQVKALPADLRAKFNKATLDDVKKR